MVDLIGDFRVVFAERIVRQLGQVNDGVEALEVSRRDTTQVFDQRRSRDLHVAGIGEQPAVTVIAVVQAYDVVPGFDQSRNQHATDIAVDAGDQNSHFQ